MVDLSDGRRVPYDRLVVATGRATRPWPPPDEGRPRGLVTIRTRDDAADRLADRPRVVLVVGAGFIGSKVALSCRELGLYVTVVDRAEVPLQAAPGTSAAALQEEHGLNLRTVIQVTQIHAGGDGNVSAATLDDGSTLQVDLVVVVGSVWPPAGWPGRGSG